MQGGDIVYAKGFGVQNLQTQIPVTLDSVFCVASISKCFVATAIMQPMERGQIHLDAPLFKYLSYFQLDDERYQQITVRQSSVTPRGCQIWTRPNTMNWWPNPNGTVAPWNDLSADSKTGN